MPLAWNVNIYWRSFHWRTFGEYKSNARGSLMRTSLQILIVVLFLAIGVFPKSALAINAWPAAPVGGVYAVNAVQSSGQIDPAVLSNPSVDGVMLFFNWSSVEPVENQFNWKSVDSRIAQAAAAGKTVSLTIMAGFQAPAWVYADGAKSFKFVWDRNWGPPLCSVQSIPLPWDSVYQAKWDAFITAFGARYDANPTVAHVKFTGLNSKTPEIFLPISKNESISNGKVSCRGYNDVANWQAAGYTRVKIESAWSQVSSAYLAAFPDKPLAAMMLPKAFPPIDDNGNLIAGATDDPQATSDMVAYSVTLYGRQFMLQNDGLSNTWIWPFEGTYAGQLNTGYQMVGIMGTRLAGADSLALGAGAVFVEIYNSDLNNTALAPTIATLHARLP